MGLKPARCPTFSMQRVSNTLPLADYTWAVNDTFQILNVRPKLDYHARPLVSGALHPENRHLG